MKVLLQASTKLKSLKRPLPKQKFPKRKKKSPLKKEEKPHEEIKKEEKQEASKSPTPPNSTSSASPTINHVLKEDVSINKLLKKSSDIDNVNRAEDPSRDTSGWEEADDEPAPVKSETVVIPTETKKEKPVKAESPKVAEPAPVSIATDRKQEEKTTEKEKSPAPSSSTTATVATTSASTKEASSAAKASNKSLGLKQSVEKLSTLVLQLEDVIDKLMKANLDKDERLLKLEQRISELSKWKQSDVFLMIKQG